MRRAVFVSSPALWEHGHGPDHPLKPERLRRTVELLSEYGALDAPNVRVVTPRPATDDELALFHTREYIDVVKALDAGDADLSTGTHMRGFGPGDNPVVGALQGRGRRHASGQSFPDQLPEQYRARYGGQWLRDHDRPPLDEVTRRRVRQNVEAVVAKVKQAHDLQA